MAPPPPPSSKATKSSPALSPYEKDGQEFGLVPKYVLRKKAPKLMDPNGISSPSRSTTTTPVNTPIKTNGTNVTTTPTINGTPNKRNGNDNANATAMNMMMKDCDDESIPYKSPEEIHLLLQQTDNLLARRWRVANLADSPAYEYDKKLLLATEDYIPSKAANRIEEHWKTKLELFGSQLVDHRITIMDHLPSHKSELGVEDGYIQILPTRDLAGRAIVFFLFDPQLYTQQSRNIRKIMFYMLSSVLEDDETVRKGINLVVFHQTDSSNAMATPTWFFDPFWNAYNKLELPYKISKLHYCQETSEGGISYSVQEKKQHDTAIRIHKGSLQEIFHGLLSYGIPSHFLPLSSADGTLETKEHLKWIAVRRRIESFPLPQQESVVLVPSQQDVLLGKRKMSMNGNVLYHQLVASQMEEYYETKTLEGKQNIRLNVWTHITATGGRFLLQIDNGPIWEALDIQPALRKIEQAFDFLCAQYYAPKGGGSETPNSKRSPYDDDLFSGWFCSKQQCFNLLHCKGVGTQSCW